MTVTFYLFISYVVPSHYFALDVYTILILFFITVRLLLQQELNERFESYLALLQWSAHRNVSNNIRLQHRGREPTAPLPFCTYVNIGVQVVLIYFLSRTQLIINDSHGRRNVAFVHNKWSATRTSGHSVSVAVVCDRLRLASYDFFRLMKWSTVDIRYCLTSTSQYHDKINNYFCLCIFQYILSGSVWRVPTLSLS